MITPMNGIPAVSAGLAMAVAAGLPLSASAQSQEMARVISSTPVIQQVAVPRQVCSNSTVVSQAPKSGAGALMGAIAGGAVGSQVGGGAGRAAAMAAGVIGGAILGDRIEGAPPAIAQPVTTCTDQAVYENRVVAYNVTYDYAGKQYTVQMPNDPGQYLPITISPAAAGPAVPPAQVVTTLPQAPVVIAPPTVTTYPSVVVAPGYPPAYGPYYGPSYGPGYGHTYSSPYYGPYYGSGVTLRWSSGGHRHHHNHHPHGWR